MSKRNGPAVLTSVALLLQAAAFYGSPRQEARPAARPLSEFPIALSKWHMLDQGSIDQDVKGVLRADDYLTRRYAKSQADSASLFVAFFQSQRAGQTPHSPKNCLPASGWMWSVSDRIFVALRDRTQPIEINRYIVSKSGSNAVVLYWYQSHGRVVAGEYKAAALVAWDALTQNRTDTALVRVVVPVTGNAADAATRTGIEFIQTFFTTLRQFLPA